ncbi:phage minor capsid protein [Paenibacillus brevis]|uniref:Phage minor capsid protein n=1 Tax=Paenibacillus brevis TaxID=2841508 RepID=A0ABS6FSM4_9BACL|nr:phage minor capsid protein [Paenibacillus brevis]MBU5673235.1 phage minor capsid protein [Paenibacillus brevis]
MADAEKLIALYTRAGEQLLKLIRSLEEGSFSRRRKERLFKEVDEILASLTDGAAQSMSQLLAQSYKEGVSEAADSIRAQGIPEEQINTVLEPLIHQQAVQAIMDDSFFRILETTDNMSQDAKRRIEEVVRTATERMLTEGISRRQATKEAVARMTEQGITGIVTSNGVRIPADKYMNGVVHYNLRKAHVTGTENTAVQNGYDLVYVNYVGITCEHCARKQGRVYSLSGNDKRWPHMTDEFKPPYHSYCVHSMSVWIEEYQSPEEVARLLDISNRIGEETRSEQHIRRYKEMQAKKAQLNADRKQFDRYRKIVPETPKTFSGFRRMKNSDSERWHFTQLDYRRQKRLIDHPELSLPNAEKATAANAKFTKYLFNPDNPTGYAKGTAFTSRLGYNANNWEELQQQILQRAPLYPATHKLTDQYGEKWEQKQVIYGRNGRPANVVVGWRVMDGTKLTTAYIKEVRTDGED